MQAIHHTLTVPAEPERAFEAFATELGAWWPPEYTWSGEVLDQIGIEPRADGACFEIGPHGFRCDWGRVTAWEPPRRLVFTWQVSPRREPVPNPDRVSEVEVRFEPGGRVELEHRAFERHGSDAENYRAALASEHGWPYILGRYAAHLAG